MLGKKDFKDLLKWRLALREQMGLEVKAAPVKDAVDDEQVAEITPLEAAENADEAIEEELSKLTAEEAAKRNRERRKRNAQRARETLKLQLNMTTPMDIGLESHAPGGDMFNLNLVDGKKVSADQQPMSDSDDEAEFMIDQGQQGRNADDEDDADLDDEERRVKELEANLDEMYDNYQNQKLARDAKHRAREARKKKRAQEGVEWNGIQNDSDKDSDDVDSEADSQVQPSEGSDSDSDSDSDASESESSRPTGKGKNKRLLTDLQDPSKQKKRKVDEKDRAAAVWYDNPVFQNVPGLDKLLEPEEEEEEEAEDQDQASEDDEASASETEDDRKAMSKPKSKGLFQPDEVVEWSSDEDEDDGYEVVPSKDYQDEEDKALERSERT